MPKAMIVLLILFAPWCAQGQISADKVNEMGERGSRYKAAAEFQTNDWSVFGNQPTYSGNPEQINGYGLSTAGQLGLKKGWNEIPGNVSVLVELNPNVGVRHFGEWYYLDDCRILVNGRWVAYKNRFKPVTPPPPPPSPAPKPQKPGMVCFEKETVDPNRQPIPMPTGVFRFFVGSYYGDPDSNGRVCLSVPVGTYEVVERFLNEERDAKFWKQIYMSKTRVTVVSGRTENITAINQKVVPPPPPPPAPEHVCPTCGEVVPSQSLTDVVLTDDLKINITVNWPGVRDIGVWWGETKIAEGATFGLVRENFSGPGKYEPELRGTDDKGHMIRCKFPITAVAPPPLPTKKAKKKGFPTKKVIVGGLLIGGCIASWQTGFPFPCGWIGPGKDKAPTPKHEPDKPRKPVGVGNL